MKAAGQIALPDGRRLPVVPHPRRRHIAIVVAAGAVTVRVPRRYSKRELHSFVAAHEQWINRALDAAPAAPAPRFADGMALPLAGRACRLRIIPGCGESMRLSGGVLYWRCPARPDAKRIRRELEGWYRVQARQIIVPQVAKCAARIGVPAPKVAIGAARTSLGTCTAAGALRFTWHLVKAPPAPLVSVVVHELCHLREFNHSRRFWQLVRAHDPAYEQSRRWFARHSAQLFAW